MPNTYKLLGQVQPSSIGNTDLYQVPSASSSVVSTLTIVNTASAAAPARVFLKKTAFDLAHSVVAANTGAGSNYTSAAYGNGVYVVAGTNTGTALLLSSADGVTWASRTSSVTGTINTVSWGNGLFIAAASSGTLSTSPDGTTWTSRTSNVASNILASVYGTTLFGANLYVAAGASGVLTTSPDGTTWTSRTSGFSTTQINALGYGAGLFIAGGASGTMTTSIDGISWTSRTSGFGTSSINGIAYGNGTFVAVGAAGTITRSTDGVTWTASTSGTASSIVAVTWTGSQFIAAVGTGITLTSTDGITWVTKANSLTGVNFTGVVAGNGRYLVSGVGGGVSGVAFMFGSIPTKQNALAYDISIAANSTTALTLGVTMSAGDALVVQSGTASSLTFSAFGSEIS